MTTIVPAAIESRIEKLARVARCPGAFSAEAANAATKLVLIARKNNVSLAGFEDILAKVNIPLPKSPGPTNSNSGPPFARYWSQTSDPNPFFTRPSTPEPQKSRRRPYKPRVPKPPKAKSPDAPPAQGCVPFGPFKDFAFEKIYRMEPGYLTWLIETILIREPLRSQIVEFLKNIENPEKI